MTRHVKAVMAFPTDNNVETDGATTLAKRVFDIVSGKTVVSVALTRYGSYVLALVTYDD